MFSVPWYSWIFLLFLFPFPIMLLWIAYSFFFFFFFFWPCHVACGILVPQPGIEPGLSVVRVRSPNHWTTWEFLELLTALNKKPSFLLCSSKTEYCQNSLPRSALIKPTLYWFLESGQCDGLKLNNPSTKVFGHRIVRIFTYQH